MIKFIEKPNLPDGKVKSLICGRLNSKIIDFLKEKDIDIYFTEKNLKVDSAVSSHCDIEAFYLGGGRIILDRFQVKLSENLSKKGFDILFTENEVQGKYPGDIILNNAIIGEYFIGNTKFCDRSVIDNIKNKSILHVNQGYARCSVLPVNESSLITDDESIYRICCKNDLDCLLVGKGDVSLDGHDYGFIGGAGGKISDDEMLFFGDITKHRNYIEILEFLNERNIRMIYFDFPLYDFGGFIPLEEWNK